MELPEEEGSASCCDKGVAKEEKALEKREYILEKERSQWLNYYDKDEELTDMLQEGIECFYIG